MRNLRRKEQLFEQIFDEVAVLQKILVKEEMPRFLAEELIISLSVDVGQAKFFSYFQRNYPKLAKSKIATNLMRVLQGNPVIERSAEQSYTENDWVIMQIFDYFHFQSKFKVNLDKYDEVEWGQELLESNNSIILLTDDVTGERLHCADKTEHFEMTLDQFLESRKSHVNYLKAIFLLKINETNKKFKISVGIYQPKP